MFWCVGWEAYGILAPQPGIRPAPSVLEGEIFNHWAAREVPRFSFCHLHLSSKIDSKTYKVHIIFLTLNIKAFLKKNQI